MPFFQFTGDHSITAAGVTTQYVEALTNVSLPYWLESLCHFDDMSMSSVQNYPVPEGQNGDLQLTPPGSESQFLDTTFKDVVIPNQRYTTGFRCDRKWLLNPQNTSSIIQRASSSLEAVRKFWIKTVLRMLNLGATSVTSRDGKLLFATDHIIGDVTGIANTANLSLTTLGAAVSGSPTNPSPEDLHLAATQAIVNTIGIKNGPGDEDYVNISNQSFHLLLPLAWMGAAKKAFGETASAQLISGILSKLGGAQIDSNSPEYNITYSCLPGLSAADTFFLYPTDTTEKPIIRRQTSLDVSEFGYDSELAKSSGLAAWLVEMWGGSGPFYFERIYRAKLVA